MKLLDTLIWVGFLGTVFLGILVFGDFGNNTDGVDKEVIEFIRDWQRR